MSDDLDEYRRSMMGSLTTSWILNGRLRIKGRPTPRYRVVAGSQSVHCCFEWTVVDTTRPVMIGGKQYEGQFEAMCETFDEEAAQLIAAALNHVPAGQDAPQEGSR